MLWVWLIHSLLPGEASVQNANLVHKLGCLGLDWVGDITIAQLLFFLLIVRVVDSPSPWTFSCP